MDRLEATGVLSAEQARRLGFVGPVTRATGLGVDARHCHPAAPYDEVPPAVVTRDGGDVLARFHVMLGEAAESVRLIGQFHDAGTGTGSGAAAATAAQAVSGGTGLGWAESSRGESLAWVALDDAGRIIRARLRPAAVRNWRGFDDACRSGNVFTDIPIIDASFWLTGRGHRPLREGRHDGGLVPARTAPPGCHHPLPGPPGQLSGRPAHPAAVPHRRDDP